MYILESFFIFKIVREQEQIQETEKLRFVDSRSSLSNEMVYGMSDGS